MLGEKEGERVRERERERERALKKQVSACDFLAQLRKDQVSFAVVVVCLCFNERERKRLRESVC